MSEGRARLLVGGAGRGVVLGVHEPLVERREREGGTEKMREDKRKEVERNVCVEKG